MFDPTALTQMSDNSNNGNNGAVGKQNDSQVVQPVDQPVGNFVDQLDGQVEYPPTDQKLGQNDGRVSDQQMDNATDQSTNQHQDDLPWQPKTSLDSPPSGMTRVPMQDDFAMSRVGDPMSQAGEPMNRDNDNQGYSDLSSDVGQSDPPSNLPGSGSPGNPALNTNTADSSDSVSSPNSEKLEDQNIFYMLGVTDGTEEQKNQFLDELQQVIWEDFLYEDVKLLLTQEEQAELDKLKAAKPDAKLEEQEEVIVYLEKLIPDLEDILLEKALELKADLMKERVMGMRELYKDKPEHLTKIDEAERLMGEGKWLSAAQALNSITTT